jgi:ribosomal protein L29
VNPDAVLLLESRAQEIKQLDSHLAKSRQEVDGLHVKLAAYNGQDPHALDSVKKEFTSLNRIHVGCGDRIQTLQKNLAGWEMDRRRFKDIMVV